MTRIELIKLIGDVLTKLDVLRGSMLPGDSNRRELDRLRKQLDGLQLRLAKTQFDDNTQAFITATAEITAINKELKKTLNKIEKVVTTLETLSRFVTAVDDIINAVIPLV